MYFKDNFKIHKKKKHFLSLIIIAIRPIRRVSDND